MKLTIFSRLVTGYFLIFALAATVSIYTITQLHHVEKVTRSILEVDNRILGYNQKLTNVLLAMINYERKYIITADERLFDNFITASKEFEKYQQETVSVSESEYLKNLLMNMTLQSRLYIASFEEEVKYIRAGTAYPVEKFKEKKERAVNEIMNELKMLRDHNRQNTHEKVKQLGDAEGNARKAAIIVGVFSLVTGIIISVFITVNITKPLSLIQKKTRDVARGEFGSDLKIASPPEIKELAQSFNTMCAKLKEIEKMKSDFFSLMSHELRTPLTTIKEGSNLFLEGFSVGQATEKQKRLLTIINEECNRLINLVTSLLDLSKMEAGMMAYNFTVGDISGLIGRVLREMEPLALTGNIRIEADIDKALPPVKIDIDRMLQVLRNLIGNAVKFTPGGGVVSLSARVADNKVRVCVTDSGVGISKEKLDVVFNKYQRAILADSGKISGSGLGLFIVKEIITAHGGEIGVESVLGKGSAFTFVLPL